MNDDPRLLEWLRVTEEALASAESTDTDSTARTDALSRMAERRAELRRSLEADTVAPCSEDLAERLHGAEERVVLISAALQADMRVKVRDLHQARNATQGYRPVDDRVAAFVSKSI